MPRPFVTNVTFKAGEIVVTVALDEFLANKPVEISGYATQNSGGFATFYDIQSVDENPDGTVVMYVTAAPSGEFKTGEPVTVSLRAASVWITVLAEEPDGRTAGREGTLAQDGATWNSVQSVGYPNARATGYASAGSDSSFQTK